MLRRAGVLSKPLYASAGTFRRWLMVPEVFFVDLTAAAANMRTLILHLI
jgi:hypothetical protein